MICSLFAVTLTETSLVCFDSKTTLSVLILRYFQNVVTHPQESRFILVHHILLCVVALTRNQTALFSMAPVQCQIVRLVCQAVRTEWPRCGVVQSDTVFDTPMLNTTSACCTSIQAVSPSRTERSAWHESLRFVGLIASRSHSWYSIMAIRLVSFLSTEQTIRSA